MLHNAMRMNHACIRFIIVMTPQYECERRPSMTRNATALVCHPMMPAGPWIGATWRPTKARTSQLLVVQKLHPFLLPSLTRPLSFSS